MTSGAILKTSLLAALLLPGLIVGLCAWAWWKELLRPWTFTLLGLFFSYALSAYLMLRQFKDLGISGNPSASAEEAFRSFLVRETTSSLILFLVVSGIVLWLLRWLLSSARS